MSLPPRVVAGDAALTERAASGDQAAFRQIYDKHAPAVFRFLVHLVGDRAGADEATQETFVRAHTRLRLMREGDKLLPWLLGIARNVFLESCRRKRRTERADDHDLEEQVVDAVNPEALLLRREADQVLAKALLAVSEERRAALVLFMDHGLAYAEIAGILDWSLPKVKVEIHRARLKLRAELAKYLGEPT